MGQAKRNTVDVSPTLKDRLREVSKSNNQNITVVTEALLERALPDFESGKVKVATVVVDNSTDGEAA